MLLEKEGHKNINDTKFEKTKNVVILLKLH